MASEAEIERLYQEFVAGGGGSLTFDNTNLTPKQYSSVSSSSNLTPLQLAQLESKQHQFNKQSALRSIADEIDANNFTNPYAARGAYSTSLFDGLGASTGVSTIGAISSALSGFSAVDKAAIFAGVLAASGVDLDTILKIGGLALLGTSMASSLTNHTNSQTANIPQTMSDASSLASMNQQFGESGNPCDQFNNLMGLLGGVFDGTLDFIDGAVTSIHGFLKQTGILDLLTAIKDAILGVAGGVLAVVGAIVAVVVGAVVAIIQKLAPIVGKIINAIAEIVSQIANELAGFADMAAALLRKALALVLGAAALDPCQSAVLMNTGTPAMKDAVTLLKHPMGTGHPSAIGTTVDTRANEYKVKNTMASAHERAEIVSGVPQSPLTAAAKAYTVQDETLHPTITPTSVDTIFDDSYKDQEVISGHWRQVIFDWRSKQLSYMVDSKAVISAIDAALATKDFSNKSALKTRLTVILRETLDHQYRVGKLTDNVSLEFYYWTPGAVVVDSQEEKILSKYNSITKPAMTRTYNAAITSLKLTKTEWNSIDSQLY